MRWTAPGDSATDASAYDLRYAVGEIEAGTWESATRVAGLPRPAHRGSEEEVRVDGLATGITYSFAVKASDTRARWSPLSNTASVTTPVPASFSITDLAVVSSGPGSVSLGWTAPADSGVPALEYDLRYAFREIAQDGWADAARVPDLPAPDPQGGAENFTVTGLLPLASYHFSLKARDGQGRWSEGSNQVEATTAMGGYSLERLTTSSQPAGAAYGDWAPDGRRIVFSAAWGAEDEPKIYLLNLGDLQIERLTNESGEMPRWSPDGRKIAFVHYRFPVPYDVPELRIMDPAPGAPSTLVASHETAETMGRPSWSPDGEELAYHVHLRPEQPWPPDYDTRMFRVRAIGGTPTLLTDEQTNGADPVWSPDGSRIAFAIRHPATRPSGIWIMPAAGGEPAQLATGEGASLPQWSPDGTRLAFRAGDASGGIWLMSATGANLTRISSPGAPTSWSPDVLGQMAREPERLLLAPAGGALPGLLQDL